MTVLAEPAAPYLKPLPQVTEANREFFEGLKRREFLVPKCDQCGDYNWVRISVEDNGIGIALEDQKRLFRIFDRVYATDKYEGTGIGLAIVQKAVERMGGRLGLESTVGKGSKFWIELRRAEEQGSCTGENRGE